MKLKDIVPLNEAAFTYDDDSFSDLYKDVYNTRPRGQTWSVWSNSTPEQKQEWWDRLVGELQQQTAAEEQEGYDSVKRVEKEISDMLEYSVVPDRKSAIERILKRLDAVGDPDYAEWQLGLPHGYLSKSYR